MNYTVDWKLWNTWLSQTKPNQIKSNQTRNNETKPERDADNRSFTRRAFSKREIKCLNSTGTSDARDWNHSMSFFKQIPECIFVFLYEVWNLFLLQQHSDFVRWVCFCYFDFQGIFVWLHWAYFCSSKTLLNALLTFLHVPDDESITEPLVVCSSAVNAKISCSTVPCYVTEDNKQSYVLSCV